MNVIALQDWVPVGTLPDIPRQGARCVRWGQTTIAIFRTACDRVFALEDRSPSAKGGPLSPGIVHDVYVTEPLHNWVISLETGEAQGADEGQVRCFPVKLDGETILLGLR